MSLHMSCLKIALVTRVFAGWKQWRQIVREAGRMSLQTWSLMSHACPADRRFLQCKHRQIVAVTTSCHSGSSPSTLIFRMWHFFWQCRQGFVAFFELIVEVYRSGTLKLFSRGFSLSRPSSHWAQHLLFLSSPFFQNPPHFSTNHLYCSISKFSDPSVRSTVYLMVRKIEEPPIFEIGGWIQLFFCLF